MGNFIWLAKDEARDSAEVWEDRPQWDKALGKYVRGEGKHRGTLMENAPVQLSPRQLWRAKHQTPSEEGSTHEGMFVWNGCWWRLEEDRNNRVDVSLHCSAFVDCPECNHTFDILDQDEEGYIARAIFSNDWDKAEGTELVCTNCSKELEINEIVY